jgi:hypothetical protein
MNKARQPVDTEQVSGEPIEVRPAQRLVGGGGLPNELESLPSRTFGAGASLDSCPAVGAHKIRTNRAWRAP